MHRSTPRRNPHRHTTLYPSIVPPLPIHMKLVSFALLVSSTTACAFAQTATVDIDITLTTPGASCAFTVSNDLDFGTAERPASGSGSVTVSPTSGARSSSGIVVSGSSSVGQARLQGQHTASYTVTRTLPSTIAQNTESLDFSGTWAQSTSASSGYTPINTASYSGTAGGAGSNFSRHFRFGGTVSGIRWNHKNGDYTGSISTSAACN